MKLGVRSFSVIVKTSRTFVASSSVNWSCYCVKIKMCAVLCAAWDRIPGIRLQNDAFFVRHSFLIQCRMRES